MLPSAPVGPGTDPPEQSQIRSSGVYHEPGRPGHADVESSKPFAVRKAELTTTPSVEADKQRSRPGELKHAEWARSKPFSPSNLGAWQQAQKMQSPGPSELGLLAAEESSGADTFDDEYDLCELPVFCDANVALILVTAQEGKAVLL
jgi:hypothetical protein